MDVRSFDELRSFTEKNPWGAQSIMHEWQKVQERYHLPNFKSSREWYDFVKDHPDFNLNPHLFIGYELVEVFKTANPNRRYQESEIFENHFFLGNFGLYLSLFLSLFLRQKPKILEHDPRYQKIVEKLKKEWVENWQKRNPGQTFSFLNKEWLDYIYYPTDGRYFSKLHEEATGRFREGRDIIEEEQNETIRAKKLKERKKIVEEYDKKAKKYYKGSPDIDPAIIRTQQIIAYHAAARYDRSRNSDDATDVEKNKSFDEIYKEAEERGWEEFDYKYPQKAVEYSQGRYKTLSPKIKAAIERAETKRALLEYQTESGKEIKAIFDKDYPVRTPTRTVDVAKPETQPSIALPSSGHFGQNTGLSQPRSQALNIPAVKTSNNEQNQPESILVVPPRHLRSSPPQVGISKPSIAQEQQFPSAVDQSRPLHPNITRLPRLKPVSILNNKKMERIRNRFRVPLLPFFRSTSDYLQKELLFARTINHIRNRQHRRLSGRKPAPPPPVRQPNQKKKPFPLPINPQLFFLLLVIFGIMGMTLLFVTLFPEMGGDLGGIGGGTGGEDIASCQFTRSDHRPPEASYKSNLLLSYIQEASSLTNIPAVVLAAFIRVESPSSVNFNDEQIKNYTCSKENTSATGALGLMQLQPQGTKGHDKYAIENGARLLGISYDSLITADYCDVRKNIIIGAGFILKKMSYLNHGDGTKWDTGWTNRKSAIDALAESYYGCVKYPVCENRDGRGGGHYSYGDDVWKSIQSCQAASNTSPNAAPSQNLQSVLNWTEKISNSLQTGLYNWFNKMISDISNSSYSAVKRLGLREDTSDNGLYWCTNLIIDAYNLAGFRGLGINQQSVLSMLSFWQTTSGYKYFDYLNSDHKSALTSLLPGYVIFFMNTPGAHTGKEHAAIIKTKNIDLNGNGSIETYDSNTPSKILRYPIRNWHIQNPIYTVVGLGGI